MPSTPENALLYAGRLVADARWRLAAHRHEHHELIAVIRGRLRIRILGREHEAGPGDLLLYPAGDAHEECADPSDPFESLFIGFRVRLDRNPPVRVQDSRGRIRTLLLWLHEDRSALGQPASALRQALLTAVLTELRYLREQREPELIRTTHAFIRQRLDQHLTLADLARAAALSRYHFIRKYRQLCSRTPMQDLRRLRVEAARDLVLTTTLPMKAIALQVGLGDEYRLSRLFRTCLGRPPGALRRRCRERRKTKAKGHH